MKVTTNMQTLNHSQTAISFKKLHSSSFLVLVKCQLDERKQETVRHVINQDKLIRDKCNNYICPLEKYRKG